MKKGRVLLAVLIAAVLTFSIAFAEEFAVRGIRFGMTRDEIKALETLEFEKDVEETTTWFDGTLSGFKQSRLGYRFDSKGGMYSISITYGNPQTPEEIREAYGVITDGLTAKYGEPLGNKGGEVHPSMASGMESMFANVYPAKDKIGAEIEYGEWWLEVPEGHVKIDHYYVYFIQNGSPIAVHSLEYTIFPENDMNTVINDL